MRTLNLVTRPYNSINLIKINLYKSSDPLVVIASDERQGPLGQEEWTFPGLIEGVNYIVRILEVDGGVTLQVLDDFTVTVSSQEIIKTKKSQLIKVGETPGFVEDTTEATLDGSNGKDDWRGWDIHLELIGAGTVKEAIEFTWDKILGKVILIEPGRIFEDDVYYFVEFEPQVDGNISVTPSVELFPSIIVVTDDITLGAADIGKKILIKGDDPYLEVTLPDIFTVLPNTPFYFETGRINHKNIAIVSGNANAIDWLKGNRTNLYMGICESLVIYREKIDDVTSAWRVHHSDGNFKTVGELISEYANIEDIINKVALDNTEYDVLEQARLYNYYVLELDPAEVVTFDEWPVGENRYKFSLANPNGKFHVPDVRDLFERASDGVRLPGSYQADQIKTIAFGLTFRQGKSDDNESGVSGEYLRKAGAVGGSNYGNIIVPVNIAGGEQTRPRSFTTRRYIRA